MRTLSNTLFCLSLAGALAACGSGVDAPSTGHGDTPPSGSIGAPTPAASPTSTHKVLMIGIDGVDIGQLQQAIAAQRMPSLARLKMSPAYTGGIAGTVTQQDTASAAGWATLLTGTWANRHGVQSDAAAQTPKTETLFHRLKAIDAKHKIAVVASSSQLTGLLQADTTQGAVDRLVDCAGEDLCVADNAEQLVADGKYDVLLANFDALVPIANTGLDVEYQNALGVIDRQVGRLLAAVDARQQHNPNESWLVVATTDRAARTKDSPPPAPQADKTIFIALNRAANAEFNAVAADLYDYPSAADVNPTVLAFLDAIGKDPALWNVDGQSLFDTPGVRQLRADADIALPKTIDLSWHAQPGMAAPKTLQIYRDGKLISTLDPAATTFSDAPPGLGADGEKTYSYSYVVKSDAALASTLAQVDYVEPLDQLVPALLDQLASFVPFDTGLNDIKGSANFAPLKSTADAPTYLDDDLGGKALAIDPKVTSYNMPANLGTRPQYTIGFWFKSDAQQKWLPIVTDKNWASGKNPGFIISQKDAANGVTINFGDGTSRVDGDLTLPSNRWVYVALTVDTVAKKAAGYMGNPGQPLQSVDLDLSKLDMVKMRPAVPLVFNEDSTGKFYSGYTIGPVAPQYNDVALWDRVLSAKEITRLYTAGKSLKTLIP